MRKVSLNSKLRIQLLLILIEGSLIMNNNRIKKQLIVGLFYRIRKLLLKLLLVFLS